MANSFSNHQIAKLVCYQKGFERMFIQMFLQAMDPVFDVNGTSVVVYFI